MGLRKADTSLLSDEEVAAWFIYLNRTGFNGLYRVNRRNEFNVPFGKYANPKICDPVLLRACHEVLRASAKILHADFAAAVDTAQAGDLVYFDPPYLPVSAYSDFTRYTSTPFGLHEQTRLRDTALALKRRGVSVLLSNSSAPAVYELYGRGFEIVEVPARRAVNSRGDRRGPISEVIIR
jgi:DNA adenine methylase